MLNNECSAMAIVRSTAEKCLDPEAFDLFVLVYNQIIDTGNMDIPRIYSNYTNAQEVLDKHKRRSKV